MSFDALEHSAASGQPVRLYEFAHGLQRWRFTTADRTVWVDTVRYEPLAIADDGIRQSGEVAVDTLTLTAPGDMAVAQLYRQRPPSTAVELTVRDRHADDTQAVVVWVGSVVGVSRPTEATCQLQCQSLAASMEQAGLRLAWERGCPHSLFDRNCRVGREPYRVPAVLLAIGPLTATAAAAGLQPDGWFAGGFLQWTSATGGIEVREIDGHAGQTLTLLGGTAGLTAEQSVDLYPGCARTIAVCDTTFRNTANYGGIPHLPGKSPFDGTPVF